MSKEASPRPVFPGAEMYCNHMEDIMNIIEELTNKKDTEAHKLLLELEKQSEESDRLYVYFDDFLTLLQSKSSFVRMRGFRLAFAQARWDSEDKLRQNADILLRILDDEKPTAVRQCIMALHNAVQYKPELRSIISAKLDNMDTSKYKDSMRPLIEKDIEGLRKIL